MVKLLARFGLLLFTALGCVVVTAQDYELNAQDQKRLAVAQKARPESSDRTLKSKVQQQEHDKMMEQHSQASPLHDKIFAKTANNLMPMSPKQIGILRELYNKTKKASLQTGMVPPKPTASSKVVDLSPGATPPVVRLASGFVTSLVFLDASGSPWPIKAYDLGDPASYNIQWDKQSSTMMVQAITDYKAGNLAVILEGLAAPVMITLMPGQKAVDYRVDVQVPRPGPNAKPMRSIFNLADNQALLTVLDGMDPQGARPLAVKGGEAQAWMLGGKMYLRTRLTLLSPGWVSKMSSADGMQAYEMMAAPVILASNHGETVKLTLEGY